VIGQGLADGESVVVDGQLRLVNGRQRDDAAGRVRAGGRPAAGAAARLGEADHRHAFQRSASGRPVMTILVMAFPSSLPACSPSSSCPVAAVPRVDFFPTIQGPGPSFPVPAPETMAASVASILERQFATIAGRLRTMTSNVVARQHPRSSCSSTLNRSIDGRRARRAVRRSSSAMRRPAHRIADGRPASRKVNPADFPVMFLALKSSQVRLSDVDAFSNRAHPAAQSRPLPGIRPGADLRLAENTQCACRANLDQLRGARN